MRNSVLLKPQIWSLQSRRLLRAPFVMCTRRALWEKRRGSVKSKSSLRVCAWACVCVRACIREKMSQVPRIPPHFYRAQMLTCFLLSSRFSSSSRGPLHSHSFPARTRWAKLRQHRVGGCGVEPSGGVNTRLPSFPVFFGFRASLVFSVTRTNKKYHTDHFAPIWNLPISWMQTGFFFKQKIHIYCAVWNANLKNRQNRASLFNSSHL